MIPQATEPHPHTMKLGEFLSHARVFGKMTVKDWLENRIFSCWRCRHKGACQNWWSKKASLNKNLKDIKDSDFKHLFSTIQETDLLAPSTKTVLSIGEEGLAKSILRLGSIDYFSVVTRKPTICDFKPVQIEVAIARLNSSSSEETVQVLRFANRVPLQFDKSGCAIVKAISSVNWKAYGLRQSRGQLPVGSYIIAVSVVSPFIKFKNASKETIDASEELVEEMRKALMQGGQRLGKHLRREQKEAVLESKIQHIEQFSPILVEGLIRITKSGDKRREKAQKGLLRILGRETSKAQKELKGAEEKLFQLLEKRRAQLGIEIVQTANNEKEIEEFEKEESAEIKEIANAIARADAGENSEDKSSKEKKAAKKKVLRRK